MSSIAGPGSPGGAEGAQAPLTEKELELVRRVFSDPFAIPLEWKAWLGAYLEANPPYLVTGSIFGFKAALNAAIAANPVTAFPGVLWDYIGETDPSEHWMLCDHRELAQADYPKLFDEIGSRYNGLTVPAPGNFCIPDIRGRLKVMKGVHPDVDTLGLTEGAALASRRPRHQHTVTTHSHLFGREVVSLTPGGTQYSITGNQSTRDSSTDNAAGPVGPQTGAEPVDAPAYIVVNTIIYVG